MMAHFAIRSLMHDAALRAHVDPDRLSFLHAVRVARRKLPLYGAIPPLGTRKRIAVAFSMKFSRNAYLRDLRAATPAASNEK
jgi:hypothetical protein